MANHLVKVQFYLPSSMRTPPSNSFVALSMSAGTGAEASAERVFRVGDARELSEILGLFFVEPLVRTGYSASRSMP